MSTQTQRDTGEIAAAYFDAWKAGDMDAYRELLADDATFDGPMGTARTGDECVDGMRRLASVTDDIVVHKRWVDGPDAITWFDLHTAGADPIAVANWTHVEDGKITKLQVTFDPRPMLPAS